MNSTSSCIDNETNDVSINRFDHKDIQETIPNAMNDDAIVPNLHNPSLVNTPLIPAKATSHNSLSSTSSKTSDCPDICRICHCEDTIDEPLISPCYCLGTMQYLHQKCLQQWMKSSGIKSCELCKFEFIVHSEIKPFKQWQKLDMNGLERRKVMFSVAFNLIAVTGVLWLLHVLIDRTNEVKAGQLPWPFWAKLVFVAICFTGGLVFLSVQCKIYFQLCIRWRQVNQRIIIHSRNEQVYYGNSSSPSRMKTSNNSGENCIITVLQANDLPPVNCNTSSTVTPGDTAIQTDSPSLTNIHRSRRHHHRRFFHRFFSFHRSNQSPS